MTTAGLAAGAELPDPAADDGGVALAETGLPGGRLPPHDMDAEEAVLGSLLIDPEAVFKVAPRLNPENFYRERHGWIFDAALALAERSEPVNQITLAHELANRGRLEACGGAAYLSHLIANTPTSIFIADYAQIVRKTSLLRGLIGASHQIEELGYQSGDADTALARSEDILFRLRHGQEVRDFVPLRQALDQYLEEAGRVVEETSRPSLIHTGLVDLDAILGGLHRSDMIILAARPSLGKTSLALSIARQAALYERAKVAIFSLEMGCDQLAQRILSMQSGVDTQRLRLGQHTKAEERRIVDATGVLAEAEIYIDDSPLVRSIEIRSKARRLHNEIGLDLVIIAYLPLMSGSSRIENRVQEISEISRSLKALARELDVPVLAVSQLSRAVEARSPHIPMLSDLRDSGSIEQDADVVVFIYREDIYYTPEEWERRFPSKPYPQNLATLIVAKHRHGPTGQVEVWFRDKLARFEGIDRQHLP